MEETKTVESNINLNFEPVSQPTLFNQMKPYLCPVCCGKSIVSAGFYNFPGNCGSITSTCAETCRACNGKGIIIA